MARIVLDTNIFISAIIRSGKPRKILKKGIDGSYSLVISGVILQEIIGVLRRSKFNMTETDIRKIMFGIIESSEIVSIRSKFKVVKNDPDDDIIVNTAYDGNADYIVSGDDDLLKLKSFKGIKIVTVSEMLAILAKNS